MNKELLLLPKCKQEIHRRWKQGQATWNKYREVVREGRNETRKSKAHLELKLAKDVKDNKKGFFKYLKNKRKTRDRVGPLLDGAGARVTENAEKSELLNAAFVLVFTDMTSQGSLTQETMVKKCCKGRPSLGQGGLG